MTVIDLLRQAQRLSIDERKQLVKLLVDTLDAAPTEPLHDIAEFEGIAAHLADDEDPQDYVNRLRAEWDDRS